jgi:hypothetical protein
MPALPGRRVRHRLTPTGTMAAVRPRRPNGQHWGRTPVLVGATRCVARRTTARQYAARQTPPRGSRARSTGPTTVGIASPAGPAGQAPPDPDQTSAVTSGHTRAAPGRALRPADPPHRCRRHGRGVGFPHAPADRHDCWSLVQVHCPVETSQAVLSFSLPSGAPQSALSASASGTTNSQTVCFSYCGGCPFTGLTGRSL